jgi:hypothetical protein
MGVGCQRQAPVALLPKRNLVPIVQEAGWAPGLVWTDAKNIAPTEIRSPDRPARSRPVASRYTKWAIPAHILMT